MDLARRMRNSKPGTRIPTATMEKTPRALKPRRFRRGWLRYCHYWLVRLRRLQGTPRAIARGIAIGVFAGSFPFFGFQTILGVLLATLLRGNRLAAAAGTWISNPFTYVPIYFFNFKVGQLLLGGNNLSSDRLKIDSWATIVESSLDMTVTLLIGCVAVGLAAAVCAYFVSLWLLSRRKGRRKKAI